MVPERVAEGVRELSVPLPGASSAGPAATAPTLLKLHGSVNWFRRGDGSVVRLDAETEKRLWREMTQGWEPFVVGPGPHKGTVTAGHGMDDIWRHAEDALRMADAIVFV